jgi:nitrile hydratase beta subunit
MNGGADLGGMMGFGPVVDEPGEPNFHADWEARVLGIIVALGACGQWNLDQSRFARESLAPATYMTLPYYAIWLEAAVKLMTARGMITDAELAKGKALVPPIPVKRRLAQADVEAALNAGGPADRPIQGTPAFAVGDTIHTINIHPVSHTRMPRYARDKIGTITRVHGFHVYPDANARGEGEQPTWLYQVAFPARTLWGEDRGEKDVVTLDLWQPYLRPRP